MPPNNSGALLGQSTLVFAATPIAITVIFTSSLLIVPPTALAGLFGFKAEQMGRNLLARYLGRKN